MAPLLEALRDHPEERDGEHEPGAQRQKVLEKGPVPVTAPGHERAPDDIRQACDRPQDE